MIIPMPDFLSKEDGTGHLTRLTGQSNFNRWMRDFEPLAKTEGLWKLFTGEETILTEPERETFLAPFRNVRSSRSTPTANVSDENAISTSSNFAYQLALDDYKDSQKKYDKQEERVRKAQGLISYSVDPAIRGKVQTFEKPQEALEWIKKRFKLQDSRALDIAKTNMENLSLSGCKNVQDYINQIEMLRLDIRDAGSVFSDVDTISKIIRGLSSSYKDFEIQYHMLKDVPGVEMDLSAITARLLTYESTIKKDKKGNT